MENPRGSKIPTESPTYRKIRIFAFDPSLATRLETAEMNQLMIQIPWEDLKQGPVGEYIEVVDFDPASGVFYEPVNLADANIIATNGLSPSESNPQFHQQMVYAVAMTTIKQFERALGRVAFWADRTQWDEGTKDYIDLFVRRLRIYPHALRDKNAYYSPKKKAVLFGYFPVTKDDKYNTPGTLIFTCLSHDIIAHEVTHALLDGVHPRFNEPTNIDVYAFHEAFADIVALFQHFSYPQILESQIRKTRGDFETESLLGQLAQEFGRATGGRSALRDALGGINEKTGRWETLKPDRRVLQTTTEPHARGAILVAAVFRAFVTIYRKRTEDLLRIATQGTGRLPDGDIHPDLTRRLSREAASSADRVLQMCIRAIDYCPPVDITFGDLLRGIITADLDYAPQDDDYRIVFIQSFRDWGIYPRGVISMGIDSLTWPSGDEAMRNLSLAQPISQYIDSEEQTKQKIEDAGQRKDDLKSYMKHGFLKKIDNWNLESDRYEVWKLLRNLRTQVHRWLLDGDSIGRSYAELFGLVVDTPKATVYRNGKGEVSIEVHSVRSAIRQTIAGSYKTDIVVEVTQRRRGYFDPTIQEVKDKEGAAQDKKGDFTYRAGSTILIDAATQQVRRVIRTRGKIDSDKELDNVRNYLLGNYGNSGNAFDAGIHSHDLDEPFAILHHDIDE
jgi:hypothetical protein